MNNDDDNIEESEAYKEAIRRFDPEYQKQQIQQRERYEKKKKEYESLIQKGALEWHPEWIDEIPSMSLLNLKSMKNPELIEEVETNFCVVWMDLRKVISKLAEYPEDIYPTTNLWWKGGRSDESIVDLIDFVKEGNKLIPPIIDVTASLWNVYDGNHRIALCRFFKITCMPFLVKKDLERLTRPFLCSS
jgi:hypothetical protein